LAQLDVVADKVADVLLKWERSRQGAPTADLEDQQRRLRWVFEALPEPVREALPLVRRLVEATWGDYFRLVEPKAAEPDIYEVFVSLGHTSLRTCLRCSAGS
jgi:hypothetical protein